MKYKAKIDTRKVKRNIRVIAFIPELFISFFMLIVCFLIISLISFFIFSNVVIEWSKKENASLLTLMKQEIRIIHQIYFQPFIDPFVQLKNLLK